MSKFQLGNMMINTCPDMCGFLKTNSDDWIDKGVPFNECLYRVYADYVCRRFELPVFVITSQFVLYFKR